MAGFDWLDMAWTYLVLRRKGCDERVVKRLERLYSNSHTIPVVNNILGTMIKNIRGFLRQGDIPSMFWFAVGLDPLLYFLVKRMKGITVLSMTPAGPIPQCSAASPPNYPSPSQAERQSCVSLPPIQEVYKLCAYADDVKCAITSMQEFHLVISACSLLEKAAGVKLHRDPSSGKVKFLPLGRWQNTLQQEDIPYQFIRLSDSLDFISVVLKSSFIQTRKVNCDLVEERVRNTVGPWRGGKFMDIVLRSFSANCHALSKVMFKCFSIPCCSLD